jgi:hypothetical protein
VAQLTVADVDAGWAGELGLGLSTHRVLVGDGDSFRLGVSLGGHGRGGRADGRWTHDAGGALGAYLGLGPSLEVGRGVRRGAHRVGAPPTARRPTPLLGRVGARPHLLGVAAGPAAGRSPAPTRGAERTVDDVVVPRTRWALELERLRWGGRPIGVGLERSEVEGVAWYAVRLRYGSAALP